MKHIISLVILPILLISCDNSSKLHDENSSRNDTVEINISNKDSFKKVLSIDNYINDEIKVDEFNIPLDSNEYYFPIETDIDTLFSNELDTFLTVWFSAFLYQMKEPLLYNKKSNKEIYRFTWLRTFHNPVAIRIENENDEYKVFWKLCDGAGGYSPGKLIINQEKTISIKEWEEFTTLVDKCNFWNRSTNEEDDMGFDGSEWILEGVDSKKYHVFYRWTPRGGNFYNACNYLIKLTDLDIDEREKY